MSTSNKGELKPLLNKATTTVTSSALVGAIIDTDGFDALTLAAASGTITDGSYASTVEESSSSTFADDVSTAAVDGDLPSFVAADDNATKKVGVLFTKRYVRHTLTPSGATSGGAFSLLAVLSKPNVAPVA